MFDINETVFGCYKVERIIAKGGSSIVYLVRSIENDIPYVMKVISGEKEQGILSGKREIAFYTICQKSWMPKLEQILKIQKDTVLILEYIEGCSLQQMFAQKGFMPAADVCKMMRQICHILSDMRYSFPDMIYGDLKPANIMIQPDGHIRLIDYGSVIMMNDNSMSDAICGTVGFSAPEIIDGKQLVGPWSDVYSIGKIMRYLICEREMRPNGIGCNRFLGWIVQKATETCVTNRFHDCKQLSVLLAAYIFVQQKTMLIMQGKVRRIVAAQTMILLIVLFVFWQQLVVRQDLPEVMADAYAEGMSAYFEEKDYSKGMILLEEFSQMDLRYLYLGCNEVHKEQWQIYAAIVAQLADYRSQQREKLEGIHTGRCTDQYWQSMFELIMKERMLDIDPEKRLSIYGQILSVIYDILPERQWLYERDDIYSILNLIEPVVNAMMKENMALQEQAEPMIQKIQWIRRNMKVVEEEGYES